MNPYDEADRLDSGHYDHETPGELHARFREIAMDPRAMAIDVIDLQRKVFARRREIENRELALLKRNGEFRTWEDRERDRMVMEFRADVYGRDHVSKHVIRYPADWWQAVKERFGPAWFRDRYPVRFIEITVSLEELYPGLQPSLPDHRATWRFHVHRRDQWPTW